MEKSSYLLWKVIRDTQEAENVFAIFPAQHNQHMQKINNSNTKIFFVWFFRNMPRKAPKQKGKAALVHFLEETKWLITRYSFCDFLEPFWQGVHLLDNEGILLP